MAVKHTFGDGRQPLADAEDATMEFDRNGWEVRVEETLNYPPGLDGGRLVPGAAAGSGLAEAAFRWEDEEVSEDLFEDFGGEVSEGGTWRFGGRCGLLDKLEGVHGPLDHLMLCNSWLFAQSKEEYLVFELFTINYVLWLLMSSDVMEGSV